MEQKIAIRELGKNTAYISASEIEYVKALRAYCIVHFKNNTHKTLSLSLKEFCAQLPSSLFCQVHRSFVINIEEIGWYDNHRFLILKKGEHIPVSPMGKTALGQAGFIL